MEIDHRPQVEILQTIYNPAFIFTYTLCYNVDGPTFFHSPNLFSLNYK